MIQSEKDLEDYICDNIECFIVNIKREFVQYEDKNIKFLGRQIKVGGQVADLVFYYDEEDDFEVKIRTFIIIELKYRICEPKDVSQLCKYINLFNELEYKVECPSITHDVRGILIGFGLDGSTREIEMALNKIPYNNIEFMQIETQLNFRRTAYFYAEEFTKKMSMDQRILDLYTTEK